MIPPLQEFKGLFSDCGLSVSDEQYEKLRGYAELLLEWNGRVNLTKITAPCDIAVKHFLDSALILKYAAPPQCAALIDVGTGAGFPGIPLKIFCESLHLTLLDSQNKRVNFLKAVSDSLLLNAACVHARAEEAGRNPAFRECYDIATARAVAPLPILCEYCLPFVKIGGAFIAMKGPGEDYKAAQSSVDILGGEISKVCEYKLPDGGRRAIIVISKVKPAPEKYPRSAARIARNPL
ncbi:MAG: 16S rRNA (guanine(527)-N(7))-methyltransferase RsmG [Oscillospiraceae bacterium]|nr:16S rRNA (guanine(527)-N(7))-methyltransferase RsmG [Oscillospiraceae bacterium]